MKNRDTKIGNNVKFEFDDEPCHGIIVSVDDGVAFVRTDDGPVSIECEKRPTSCLSMKVIQYQEIEYTGEHKVWQIGLLKVRDIKGKPILLGEISFEPILTKNYQFFSRSKETMFTVPMLREISQLLKLKQIELFEQRNPKPKTQD